MTISEIVVEYRKEHHLSQRAFAEICGVSHGYISILEKGINPATGEPLIPTLPVLKKIANAMGTTVDDLFKIADDMTISLANEIPKEAVRISKDQIIDWIMNDATMADLADIFAVISDRFKTGK